MNTQAEDGVLSAARALLGAEEYARARRLLVNSVERARDTGAIRVLALLLAVQSELDYRVGQWGRARSAARESLGLCQALQEHDGAARALVLLARLDAAEGLAADCLRHLTQSRRLIYVPSRLTDTKGVEGFLALGLGDSQRTIELLEQPAHNRESAEWPPEQWVSDLIEAYARSGRQPEARRLLRRFRVQARRAHCRWALVAAARGTGLVARRNAFDRHFQAGLAPRLTAEVPFERARTELCYGERLRRVGRRRDSRSQLSSALDTFEELGADPWAIRACGELRSSSEHVRVAPHARSELTPQEVRVAFLVARGWTNREAATTLFVSEKTIEFHLRSIFRKLGVRSRAQLAYQLGRAEAERDLSTAAFEEATVRSPTA
jgi:DNA-binding CsgD family transcriptional regulator